MSWRWLPPVLAIVAVVLAIGLSRAMRLETQPELAATAEAPPGLALRASPDGGAPSRGTLPPERTTVEVIVRQGNWAEIRHGELAGWVLRSELGERSR